MLPHLTALSKTFQTGEQNFSWTDPPIDRALLNIYLLQKRWELTEKLTAEFLVEDIALRFPKISKQIRNCFNYIGDIQLRELFPTS